MPPPGPRVRWARKLLPSGGITNDVVIDVAAATTTTLVAAVAGLRVYVYRVVLFVNGANSVTWQDTNGAALFPVMAFGANSGLVLDEADTGPWMTTPLGTGLQLVTSAAVQASGRIYYVQA